MIEIRGARGRPVPRHVEVQRARKRIDRMRLFLRLDAVEQGASAEREQVEQRRGGVLLDEPRQQIDAFRRQFRDPACALRLDSVPCGGGGQVVRRAQQVFVVVLAGKRQIVARRSVTIVLWHGLRDQLPQERREARRQAARSVPRGWQRCDAR